MSHPGKLGRPRLYKTNADRQRAYRRRQKLCVHFKSETVIWETPQAFFDQLDREYGFTLDVCALPENAKCAEFYSPEQDGLMQPWRGVCWCNPPYGREIGLWVQKAYESTLFGAATVVVCLLPARTDTAWWHRYIQNSQRRFQQKSQSGTAASAAATAAAEVTFLPGRLKFGGSKDNAPFPSAIVVFRASSAG